MTQPELNSGLIVDKKFEGESFTIGDELIAYKGCSFIKCRIDVTGRVIHFVQCVFDECEVNAETIECFRDCFFSRTKKAAGGKPLLL